MIQQYKRVKKTLEKKVNCKIDDLTKITNKIVKQYGPAFSAYNIFDNQYFPSICRHISNKDKNCYWTLTEKCIKRNFDINGLYCYFEDDEMMLNKISDAKILYSIIKNILPLDILFGMEYQKEDSKLFNDSEQKIFEYLTCIAKIYLEETDNFEKILEDKNNTQNKVKKKKENNNKKRHF